MVNSTSITVETPNIEILNINGKINPADEKYISIGLDRNNLSEEHKKFYDDVIDIVSSHTSNIILNTKSELVIDRMTSKTLEQKEEILDWKELPLPQKEIFLNFMKLILNELEKQI